MPHIPGLLHPPLGQAGIGDDLEPPLACAAKVENSSFRCFRPHEGHSISGISAGRRTSFSNFVPQSWQLYSKMGMVFYSIIRAQIRSMMPRTSEAWPLKLFTRMENATQSPPGRAT